MKRAGDTPVSTGTLVMGQHHVPQELLRHFECPDAPGLIWQYDKRSREWKQLPIKNVAQARDLYSRDDEQEMNTRIEAPAHGPLNRLRGGEDITDEERKAVSNYLASLVFRSPRTMETRREFIRDSPRQVIEAGARALGQDLTESELYFWPKAVAQTPIDKKHPAVRGQGVPRAIGAGIERMRWTVVRMSALRMFVADHPVYFDEALGMRDSAADLAIPLAPDIALLANHSGPPRPMRFLNEATGAVSPNHIESFAKFCRAMNRRTVWQSKRFLFAHERMEWVSGMATNPQWNRRPPRALPEVRTGLNKTCGETTS